MSRDLSPTDGASGSRTDDRDGGVLNFAVAAGLEKATAVHAPHSIGVSQH
ncbi:hypothetical protein [Halopiger aswanensis]|nr:hypothetical protein [Halopiger aswanensis]